MKRRRVAGGIRYFQPGNEDQLNVLQFRETGALVLGGNRGGKTVVGAAETTYRLLGIHPHKRTHRPPIKVWAASQDLPGNSDSPHKQLEELKRWLPQDALRGGRWDKAYSPLGRTLHLANGSMVVFKGYDQGLLKFESDAVHFAWMDEEPADKRIWSSCLLRLADYDGQWMITATPVLSLQGKGWLEELYEGRNKADCSYRVHQLLTLKNPHLSAKVVHNLFGSLTDEERAVRSSGAFARMGGRVLSEYDPVVHLVRPFLPPREWRHVVIIDPGGRNATAVLWAAIDPQGEIWLYAEHYERDQLPDHHMAVIHAMHCALGAPPAEVYMDPAAWSRERTLAQGKLDRSVVEEYELAALTLCAKWFQPGPASNADHFAWRLKRYFKHRRIHVMEHLTWWRWEAERWTYQAQRQGMAAGDKGIPEAPKDKDNHLMDCSRYLVNLLPEELVPEPRDLPQTSAEAHWQRMQKGYETDRNEALFA